LNAITATIPTVAVNLDRTTRTTSTRASEDEYALAETLLTEEACFDPRGTDLGWSLLPRN
jgi:hypothetical protein